MIKALGRGGAEVLLREGHSVADPEFVELEYACLRESPDDLVEELEAQGAIVHRLRARNDLHLMLLARRLRRLLREREIDVVHAHLPLAGVVARLGAGGVATPVVYTEHNVVLRYHPVARMLNRVTWRRQQHAIAIAEDVRESIDRYHGNSVPVSTVFNGVNTDRFQPTPDQRAGIRKTLGIPSEASVVGTVAVFRDTPQKRLDLWIEAISLALMREPKMQALLVGDGALRGQLEQQAAETGVGDRFHFVGRQTDVRPYLAAMDVFVVASAYEGFGVAPAEAMSMGIPVVSTDVSGVREVVRDGETGYLVPFDDRVVTNLADAVARLLDDPDRRIEFGRNARERVKKHLSMRRMQAELEGIYRRVVREYDGRVKS